jgi:hypothetical protein
MALYDVPLEGTAGITVTIETDETDPEVIAEQASLEAKASLCSNCSGKVALGDEWLPTMDPTTGKAEVTRKDG